MSASRFTSERRAASPRPAARPLPPRCPRARFPRAAHAPLCALPIVQPTRREDSRGLRVPGAHSPRPRDDTDQHTNLSLGVQEAMWQVICGLNTVEMEKLDTRCSRIYGFKGGFTSKHRFPAQTPDAC
eukprot:scaffold80015_cov60-Phaeocystis_antarctica.AAC.4